MPKALALAGIKFNRLTVIERAGSNKHGKAMWRCACICGRETIAVGCDLRNGDTGSCGCLKIDATIAANTTHGLSGSHKKECLAWHSMRSRCKTATDKDYPGYGGRGITVDPSWDNFETFIHDMGCAPSGTSIDRIDNSKGYCKENCKWSTAKEQARNTRNNRLIEFNGETHCMAEWDEIQGFKPYTIAARMRCGWSFIKALYTPLTGDTAAYVNHAS